MARAPAIGGSTVDMRQTSLGSAHRGSRTDRRSSRVWAAIALVAALTAGCGTRPMAQASFDMTADELLTHMIQSGDGDGEFTNPADFSETCSVYLAGTDWHQLVIGWDMLTALRDTELAVRGYPDVAGGAYPLAGSPIPESFRSGVVSRCTEQPSSLVREVASVEYMAHRDIYKPL